MKDRDKLAELRLIDHQPPEMSHANFKLIFCFVSTAILCTSAASQENTTNYWMNKAEELTHNGSIAEAILAYDKALKIEPENTTVLICKASDLNVVGKANESFETYLRALNGHLDSPKLQHRLGTAKERPRRQWARLTMQACRFWWRVSWSTRSEPMLAFCEMKEVCK
jgi:tetratricopeptide (TPR) repeat protein